MPLRQQQVQTLKPNPTQRCKHSDSVNLDLGPLGCARLSENYGRLDLNRFKVLLSLGELGYTKISGALHRFEGR